MSYRDPHNRHLHDSFWEEGQGTPGWAKVVVALILAVGAGAAIAIYVSRESSDTETAAKAVAVVKVNKNAAPQATTHEHSHMKHEPSSSMPPATAGVIQRRLRLRFPPSSGRSVFQRIRKLALSPGRPRGPAARWRRSARIRRTARRSRVEQHQGADPRNAAQERGEALGSEEEAWAMSAITASDNEPAASLFRKIKECRQGGLTGASQAVESVLHEAGSAFQPGWPRLRRRPAPSPDLRPDGVVGW